MPTSPVHFSYRVAVISHDVARTRHRTPNVAPVSGCFRRHLTIEIDSFADTIVNLSRSHVIIAGVSAAAFVIFSCAHQLTNLAAIPRTHRGRYEHSQCFSPTRTCRTRHAFREAAELRSSLSCRSRQ